MKKVAVIVVMFLLTACSDSSTDAGTNEDSSDILVTDSDDAQINGININNNSAVDSNACSNVNIVLGDNIGQDNNSPLNFVMTLDVTVNTITSSGRAQLSQASLTGGGNLSPTDSGNVNLELGRNIMSFQTTISGSANITGIVITYIDSLSGELLCSISASTDINVD